MCGDGRARAVSGETFFCVRSIQVGQLGNLQPKLYKLQAVITDIGVAQMVNSRKVMVQEFKESRLNDFR